MIITSNLGFHSRVHILQTVVNEDGIKPKEANDELKKILTRIQKAYPKRNNAIHPVWSASDKPKTAQRRALRVKGKLRLIDEDVTSAELGETIEEIRQIGEDLSDFMKRQNLTPDNSTLESS